MERSRRLGDLLAGPAAELLPHMFGDEQLPRHHIQRLGDILADLREFGAATARAAGWSGMHDAPARQVIGKVAALFGRRMNSCTGMLAVSDLAASSPAAAANSSSCNSS